MSVVLILEVLIQQCPRIYLSFSGWAVLTDLQSSPESGGRSPCLWVYRTGSIAYLQERSIWIRLNNTSLLVLTVPSWFLCSAVGNDELSPRGIRLRWRWTEAHSNHGWGLSSIGYWACLNFQRGSQHRSETSLIMRHSNSNPTYPAFQYYLQCS
jgi:hypothetical protein